MSSANEYVGHRPHRTEKKGPHFRGPSAVIGWSTRGGGYFLGFSQFIEIYSGE
jgi:hypothetical protein